MTFTEKIAYVLGFVPAQKVQTAAAPAKIVPQKPAKLTALAVNQSVRDTLTMARNFYAERNDKIVSTDLQNYLDAYEDALLLSATDDSSVSTAKLFGQIG